LLLVDRAEAAGQAQTRPRLLVRLAALPVRAPAPGRADALPDRFTSAGCGRHEPTPSSGTGDATAERHVSQRALVEFMILGSF
jgi:hypothetical protein